ncbi:hypothetical protein ELE36_03165 [Pseudolysobacter antarcticus]|uniref:Leucine-rich repeat-containing N-terminal plant-type domain-containing protein n=1 Tax=Pseudolysobacter antarcticus TaxID=2511995 RepID=A0A411HG62_9GAMM|nr:hypothetical protein [Pseudolysobacter antarcticus]QBB69454.1 hypothetical protein ELE36_03165 [Pseudolysobacter antarcticus]
MSIERTDMAKLKHIFSAMLGLALCIMSVLAIAAIPKSERKVLTTLYLATGGDGWNINNNWCNGTCPLIGTPKFNAPGTECTWAHVTCNADQTHVTVLVLGDNNLVGQLTSLQGLTQLQAFAASWNNLSGSIPDFSGMTSLQDIDLSTDQLSGSFPDLTKLTGLYHIDVSFNQLSGSIPDFSNLPLLEGINANNNQLSGTLPPLVGLPQLQELQLSNNRFSGAMPTFAGLYDLDLITLDGNLLTGSLPDLSDLNVGIFYADHNQLTGSVTPTNNLDIARICPNPLSLEPNANDAAWDYATRNTPWWGPAGEGCDHIFSDPFGEYSNTKPL